MSEERRAPESAGLRMLFQEQWRYLSTLIERFLPSDEFSQRPLRPGPEILRICPPFAAIQVRAFSGVL